MLSFPNEEEARRTLASLQSDPNIAAAALYDEAGNLFVRFPLLLTMP